MYSCVAIAAGSAQKKELGNFKILEMVNENERKTSLLREDIPGEKD